MLKETLICTVLSGMSIPSMASDNGAVTGALDNLSFTVDLGEAASGLDSTTSFESLGVVELDDLPHDSLQDVDRSHPLEGMSSGGLEGFELDSLSSEALDQGDDFGLDPDL
jgi:hypothetical protein